MPLTAPSSVGLYDGRFLAATEKVIVASMNYRLGAMGFLALPPAAPGNVGLWDQHLALSWLRGNVAAFGGDPARLTLFGESAGASSVSFHLLSPWSRPLFTQAVMQSGSANAPWTLMTPEQARQKAQALGRLMGCADDNNSALVRWHSLGKLHSFISLSLFMFPSPLSPLYCKPPGGGGGTRTCLSFRHQSWRSEA
uniref:Carboxylic ester hydrolase n=1 Tax=Sphenodon punctatus TaxID=8508 RepID=A0A8D0H5Q7_SPHPU